MMRCDRFQCFEAEKVASRRPRSPSPCNTLRVQSHRLSQSPRNVMGRDPNEFRPHVTAAIYILQALGAIAGFLIKLSTIIYNRLFTVKRVELLTVDDSCASNSRSHSRSDGKHGRLRSVSRNRPYLPSERDLAMQTLWNYMKLNQPLVQSGVIVLLGNLDYRTYEYACQLWSAGWAELILFVTASDSVSVREDQVKKFLRIADVMNIPQECIVIESQPSNIVDAINSVYNVVKGSKVEKLIFIHLPFMERLVLLMFKQIWPDKSVKAVVTSPAITLVNYPTDFTGTEQQLSEDLIEAFNFLLKYDKSIYSYTTGSVSEAYSVLTGIKLDFPSRAASSTSRNTVSTTEKSQQKSTKEKSASGKMETTAIRKNAKNSNRKESNWSHSSSLRNEFKKVLKI